jgi:hypothetical protein
MGQGTGGCTMQEEIPHIKPHPPVNISYQAQARSLKGIQRNGTSCKKPVPFVFPNGSCLLTSFHATLPLSLRLRHGLSLAHARQGMCELEVTPADTVLSLPPNETPI